MKGWNTLEDVNRDIQIATFLRRHTKIYGKTDSKVFQHISTIVDECRGRGRGGSSLRDVAVVFEGCVGSQVGLDGVERSRGNISTLI